MAEDLYQVLGVPRSANLKAIRRAYREKARKYHPDVNKDPSAEETFKRISEAHDVLSDPETRALYDRFGEDFRQYEGAGSAGRAQRTSVRQSGAGPSYQTWTGFSGSDPTGVSWEDLFGDVFTGPRTGRGANVSAELELTVEEAFRGGRRTISVSDPKGRSRQYDIDIPAGVQDGERIRVPGAGAEGRDGVGDMLIAIRVKGSRKYRLDGADIEMDLPVTPWEAALGAEVLTHTPGGPVTVRVPAGSSSGRRLRLRGQGMPRPGGRAGDLYARLKIMVPPQLTPRERELFEQLSKESRFQPRRAS